MSGSDPCRDFTKTETDNLKLLRHAYNYSMSEPDLVRLSCRLFPVGVARVKVYEPDPDTMLPVE